MGLEDRPRRLIGCRYDVVGRWAFGRLSTGAVRWYCRPNRDLDLGRITGVYAVIWHTTGTSRTAKF